MYRSALGDFADEKAETVCVAALRRMTRERRFKAARELWQMAVELACGDVRQRHPERGAAQAQDEVARRTMMFDGTARPAAPRR